MKRQVALHVEEAFRRLEGEGTIKPADYQLIDTAGDGFFFHFRAAKAAFRFADALQRITTAHNSQVTDEIAEHWFRAGAATGDAAWDDGKPVGHVVNVGSRLQSASVGGDFVIDQATFDDLPPEIQAQFGPKEIIRDKHDKTYGVYRTAFGRVLAPVPISTPGSSTSPAFHATPTSDHEPVRIVPKGLRSFDAQDADFFLELLPGARDRDGLPDSIRFWKTRIEEMDAEKTFAVGLICGPSGCGKSSLVNAGLLPRLSGEVLAVYIEATAEETETRLLGGLRKCCPSLPGNLSLPETLAALRRGQSIAVGKKVLIVLDQFEQWLHAKKEEQNTELVQALRHCDGGKVQCIVMVRDDFWMAVIRFMRELEIRLLEGQNSAAVDLFPIRHAEKVLAAFGRAFGVLPDTEPGKDQQHFLQQAVSGLAQEGEVISVRLALFAEMMKGKQWTLASLKEVGGTEGVGVTFLEEIFSAASALPEHRYHQKAARGVLNALLPESGTNIKGHMRSREELLDASGYAGRGRAKDFDDLIQLLDSEIRLITPTDPEGQDAGEPKGVSPRSSDGVSPRIPDVRYYQLTHDYLVQSLREWINRKQTESPRGRAELRLDLCARAWNARPERRMLPSMLEWLSIMRLTKRRHWTPPQRLMMRAATKDQARFAIFLGGILAGVLFVRNVIIEDGQSALASAHVKQLLNAEAAQVPSIVASMQGYRTWANPLLLHAYAEEEKAEWEAASEADRATHARRRLRASLALLPVDPAQVDFLYTRLLDAEPQEVLVIRDALVPRKDSLLDKLWSVVESPEKDKDSQRLRAAAALAVYNRENQRWTKVSGVIVEELVSVNPTHLGVWCEAFRPVKARLLIPLSTVFRQQQPERTAERMQATNLLLEYAADQPQILANLLLDADEKQFAIIYRRVEEKGEAGMPLLFAELAKRPMPDATEETKDNLAKRKANAAVSLLKMGHADTIWPVLHFAPDSGGRE